MTKGNPKSQALAAMIWLLFGVVVLAAIIRTQAAPRGKAARADASSVVIDADDIGGVVTSSKGPEAGVWVIAETSDLPTKFRKIVVTDDAGRFVVPDLPKANYKVWVRGYGLVDSAGCEHDTRQDAGAQSRHRSHAASRRAILSRRLLVLADQDAAQERLPDEDTVARWPAHRQKNRMLRATSRPRKTPRLKTRPIMRSC